MIIHPTNPVSPITPIRIGGPVSSIPDPVKPIGVEPRPVMPHPVLPQPVKPIGVEPRPPIEHPTSPIGVTGPAAPVVGPSSGASNLNTSALDIEA